MILPIILPNNNENCWLVGTIRVWESFSNDVVPSQRPSTPVLYRPRATEESFALDVYETFSVISENTNPVFDDVGSDENGLEGRNLRDFEIYDEDQIWNTIEGGNEEDQQFIQNICFSSNICFHNYIHI